jgi:hypothetical protein
MTSGIDLAIAADTRSAMSAIQRGLLEPLEDVSEILETFGDDAEQSTEQLERGMRDAQRKTEDAKNEIRELRDGLNKAGRSGKDAGDDIERGMDRAKAGVNDLKDESNSTAREAAASFDGSAESIADAFQEVAANAFAGFGPAGAIAGLAAAAGIGLAVAGFTSVEEERKKLEERAADLAQAYIDAGSDVLDALTVTSRTADILTDPERRREAEELSKLLGGDLSLATRVLAGDSRALGEAQTFAAAQERELNDLGVAGIVQSSKRKSANDELKVSHDALTTVLEREAETQRTAGETARVQSDIYLDMINSTRGVTEEVDALGNRLYTLPDGKQIMIAAETGTATANVDGFKGDLDGIPRDVTTTVRVDADTGAVTRAIDNLNGRTVYVRVAADGRRGMPFE